MEAADPPKRSQPSHRLHRLTFQETESLKSTLRSFRKEGLKRVQNKEVSNPVWQQSASQFASWYSCKDRGHED